MKHRTYSDLPVGAKHYCLAFAAICRESKHTGTGVNLDEEGVGHLKGGFARARDRGDVRSDEREAFAYTKAEATSLWASLRERGVDLGSTQAGPRGGKIKPTDAGLDQAEGILQESLARYDDGQTGRIAFTRKEILSNARDRAREAGLCIVCRREPAREGRSTCVPCNYAAIVRVAKQRAKKRSKQAE